MTEKARELEMVLDIISGYDTNNDIIVISRKDYSILALSRLWTAIDWYLSNDNICLYQMTKRHNMHLWEVRTLATPASISDADRKACYDSALKYVELLNSK